MRLLIFAVIVVALLVCGAKYLQYRAENMDTIQSEEMQEGDHAVIDHQVYQIQGGKWVLRKDLEVKP